MTEFKLFRHVSTGVIANYPADYDTHPVFGYDLEPYVAGDDEYEEDKVVVSGHELPVDQRGVTVAYALNELKVDELQEILTERGLPTSGKRDELIARIEADNSDKNED